MKRCYLHIGTPKTASTTIQHFLHNHGPALHKFGYLVPTVGVGSGGNHFAVVTALSGLPVPVRHSNIARDLMQEISNHPAKDIVLSSEVLERLLRRYSTDNPVMSYFKRAGFEVILVGYYRNQPQRINSGYSQAVKSLKTSMSLDFRANQISESGKLDYTFWTRFAVDNRCQLMARPFNASVRSAGIVEDFLATLGIRNHGLRYNQLARANRSPGPCALAAVLEVMRCAEQRGHKWTRGQRAQAKKLLSKLIDEPQFAEESFCGLDNATAHRIQAFYKPMNDRFAHSVWDCDWATVFKEDVETEFVTNTFDPATASDDGKKRYEAILDRLRSGMQAIMTNPQLQKGPAL